MPALSTYLGNKILDHVLRNTTYTSPSTVYAALFTTTATLNELKAGTLSNEVTGGSYARLAITTDAASSSATANSALLAWTGLPSVTVGYVAIMDALTSGNVLFYGALALPGTISDGEFEIPAGDLDLVMN